MNRAYIAFGSNMGDMERTIEKAFSCLERDGMKIIKKSSLYRTEPYGFADQPSFINGAVEIETALSCKEVLIKLLEIEMELGRVRTIKWGPRTIDLDIVFFNNEIHYEEDLVVPHPDMQNRDFVLRPLNDICPEYVHPVIGKTVRQMLEEL